MFGGKPTFFAALLIWACSSMVGAAPVDLAYPKGMFDDDPHVSALGHLIYPVELDGVPVPGGGELPLRVVFNSSKLAGPLGKCWEIPVLESSAVLVSEDLLKVTLLCGKVVWLSRSVRAREEFKSPGRGWEAVESRNDAGGVTGYVMSRADGWRLEFDERGRLWRLRTDTEVVILWEFERSRGVANRIRSRSGDLLNVKYEDGRIVELSGSGGVNYLRYDQVGEDYLLSLIELGKSAASRYGAKTGSFEFSYDTLESEVDEYPLKPLEGQRLDQLAPVSAVPAQAGKVNVMRLLVKRPNGGKQRQEFQWNFASGEILKSLNKQYRIVKHGSDPISYPRIERKFDSKEGTIHEFYYEDRASGISTELIGGRILRKEHRNLSSGLNYRLVRKVVESDIDYKTLRVLETRTVSENAYDARGRIIRTQSEGESPVFVEYSEFRHEGVSGDGELVWAKDFDKSGRLVRYSEADFARTYQYLSDGGQYFTKWDRETKRPLRWSHWSKDNIRLYRWINFEKGIDQIYNFDKDGNSTGITRRTFDPANPPSLPTL